MYILIFLLSVGISSISQVLLKSSANKKYNNKIREYLNLKVIIAYMLFFTATLITILSYKYINLSLGAILEATGYIFVALLGRIFLHEKVGRCKRNGLGCILLGIVVFNLEEILKILQN